MKPGASQLGILGAGLTLALGIPAAALAQADIPANPQAPDRASNTDQQDSADSEEGDLTVNTLLDDQLTSELHDDTTILRTIGVPTTDSSGKVLLDALRFWLGGTVQYDNYNMDGLYSHDADGDRESGTAMRRLEGTLRAQLFEWGEVKAQFDFDQAFFRDLYLRWVAREDREPVTITLGQQKEPMGLDTLVGNKFGIAQEPGAPVHAFGRWRSLGIRLHKSFELKSEERKFNYWEGDSAFMTTSLGVFTEDLKEANDTELAVTGRVTAGRRRQDVGEHVAVSFSYREGDFYRISMRPEIQHAERITLARPQANTLGILAVEGAYNNGPLHLQTEIFATDYGGRVDGNGAGAYFLAGWFLTGETRNYQPKWGILAPHTPLRAFSAEIFARVSHTRGDDDSNGWNDFKSLTLGGNLYYRKLRASLNILHGQTREAIDSQDQGLALNLRLQYFF